MFRYCTGLVSFCGLYVLQKCRVSISFVRIDVFGTNQVFFLCVKAVAIKIYHGQLFCLQYRLRKFCLRLRQVISLRKNNGGISAVTQRAAVANSSVSFGVFRWLCVLFEKLKFCRWFVVSLPWERNPSLVFAVLGATSVLGIRIFLFVATDNPARKQSGFSK